MGDIAANLLNLLVGSEADKWNWGWGARPVNETGKQVEEGDQIKLKSFLVEADFLAQMYGQKAIFHAEQICTEFDEGGYWCKAVGGDKQWDKATVFTVKKITSRDESQLGWGLTSTFDGKTQQVSNHGDWINFFEDNRFNNVCLGALRCKEPNLYEFRFRSKPSAPICSHYRLNNKASGRRCIFMVMSADAPDPNPGAEMQDNIGKTSS